MIYYNPIGESEPTPTVEVDYYEVYQDENKLGEVDEPADKGMPDSIGGIAPDAVREFVESHTDKTAYEVDRRTEYQQGTP